MNGGGAKLVCGSSRDRALHISGTALRRWSAHTPVVIWIQTHVSIAYILNLNEFRFFDPRNY